MEELVYSVNTPLFIYRSSYTSSLFTSAAASKQGLQAPEVSAPVFCQTSAALVLKSL